MSPLRRGLALVAHRLSSFPVAVKILGIGAIVATVFGLVSMLQLQWILSRVLHEALEQRATALALSLAGSLERPLSTADLVTTHETIRRVGRIHEDVRYVIVRDDLARVLTHTFDPGIPPDLLARRAKASGLSEPLLWFRVEGDAQAVAGEDLVVDVMVPVLRGKAGSVQLGLADAGVKRELGAARATMLRGLALSVVVGVVLALGLTRLLTHPIAMLQAAVRRIAEGDLGARAAVLSGDEVGALASAFNQMAASLEAQVEAVRDKEKARLVLLDRVVRTQEDERRAISRELHDHIGGSLSALRLGVCALDASTPERANAVAGLSEQIGQIVRDVQRLVVGMRPPLLDEQGLEVALTHHFQRIGREGGLVVELQFDGFAGAPRLPVRAETTLFRIAQEALTNIVRHADARAVSGVILRRGEEVVMLIEDDGCGFEAHGELAAPSPGLGGMHERARLLGGECVVESRPGAGTTVRVRLPLPPDDRPGEDS